jgi:SAM-dependent methyltransferase
LAQSICWRDEWRSALEQLPHVAFDTDNEIIRSYWDEFAKDYSKGAGMTSDLDMLIFDHMSGKGIIKATDRILDIGCGAGNFSLPFASLAKEVEALDISSSMLDILKHRASAEGYENITYSNERWETYSPSRSYDLVFSSFCPATCNLGSILKMESISNRQCCMITLAPGSNKDIYMELCGELSGRGLSNRAYDALMPLGVLHEMGRDPRMELFSVENDGRTNERELERSLISYVGCFMKIGDRQRDIIKERVARVSQGPRSEKIEVAMVLWDSPNATAR